MTHRVEECIYPERGNCKGCEQSYNPALFDGGCMLHFKAEGDRQYPEPPQRTTEGEHRAKNRVIKRGI